MKPLFENAVLRPFDIGFVTLATQDFSIDKPTDAFKLNYLGTGLSFVFEDYDAPSGCYNITLRRENTESSWRLWVSKEDSKDRDLDTKHSQDTSTRFCTKWMHIHLKQDQ